MPVKMKWFASVLRSAIASQEISLTEAAKRIGVTPGSVCRWRNGEEIPVQKKYLVAISREFDIDFEALCVIAFTSRYPFLEGMFRKEVEQFYELRAV